MSQEPVLDQSCSKMPGKTHLANFLINLYKGESYEYDLCVNVFLCL